MILQKIILFVFILSILLFAGCQKNPVSSDAEPLEFPDYPETPE